eukprot:SM000229S07508  [mRNA]  locus=s229:181901:185230:+ [translate_table: standard]
MAAQFVPATDMEKRIAELLASSSRRNERHVEAGEMLELNKLTVQEVQERQERLARMRSLLFQHEVRARRVRRIKSKAFHRVLQKQRRRNGSSVTTEDAALDPEAVREAAVKEEFKRAQERMTLKHRNTSQWARRILQRGLAAHPTAGEGTREAIAEQLRTHATLTREVHSAALDSSDAEDGEEEGGGSTDSDSAGEQAKENHSGGVGEDSGSSALALSSSARKAVAKAKAAAMRALEEGRGGAVPPTGLFALPFMAKAIERKRREAQEDAAAMLEELEQAVETGRLEDVEEQEEDAGRRGDESGVSGRMVFTPGNKWQGLKQAAENEDKDENGMALDVASDSDGSEDAEFRELEGRREAQGAPRFAKGSARAPATARVSGDGEGLPLQETAEGLDFRTWAAGALHVPVAVDSARSFSKRRDTPADVTARAKDSARADVNADPSVPSGRSTQHVAAEAVDMGDLAKEATIGRSGNVKASSIAAALVHSGSTSTTVQRQTASAEALGRQQSQQAMVAAGRPEENAEVEGGYAVGRRKAESPEGPQGEDESRDEAGSGGDELFDQGLQPEAGQWDLIRRAFAGDDVEAEFAAAKSAALAEEVPAVEGPVSLPGWGQWTGVQKRRGPPAWLLRERAELERKREAALARRKDAKLKHVIISEKVNKKAAQYYSSSLPYPFTSKEAFESSLRTPIGRKFNTDVAFREMTRPAILTTPGAIIEPIKYIKPAAAGKQPRTATPRQRGAASARRNSFTAQAAGKRLKLDNGPVAK